MRGTWQGSGTWQSSGPNLAPVVFIVLLVVFGGAVAAAIVEALVILAVAGVVVVAGVLAFVIYMRRHPGTFIPQPQIHGFVERQPEPKALPAKQPPQIVNTYFGGTHYHAPAGEAVVHRLVRGEGESQGRE